MRLIRLLLVAMAMVAACARVPVEVAPAAPSPLAAPPATTPAVLHAGLALADITPPPGPGLAGSGPEGRAAAGYRARLHARALLLQDRRGEIIAVVVADLPFTSVLLQRRVASLVLAHAPIGADRLLLAATHTHSAPGHFLDAEPYNRQGSSVAGYDPAMVEFLAQRIAAAVISAWESRRPARIAWGTTGISGVTRNRSPEAGGAEPDSTLVMLRVDLRSGPESTFRPAGSLSIFAIHGTGNSAENDLWDSDISGRVAGLLEAHADSVQGDPGDPPSRVVQLFANGAEGDVSPIWPAASRCAPPTLRRSRMGGSRGLRGWQWVGPEAPAQERCLAAARDGLEVTSRAIAARAASLFDSLRPGVESEALPVARAFATLPLTGAAAPALLCAEAEPGGATVGGAEDVRTRYHGWRFLGFIPSAFEEGPRATRSSPRGCQAEKRPALDGVLRRISGIGRGFPEVAQLAVVRIGGLVLAAVPAEATTAAGAYLSGRVRAAADAAGAATERVAIVGLTNGFMQYVTTREEYRTQHYEGASTLYGPGTAEALGDALAVLAGALGPPGSPSPAALMEAIELRPGAERRVMPRPAPASRSGRRIVRLACTEAGIGLDWEDAPPGGLDISAQSLVRIERLGDTGAKIVARDDAAIEVRSAGPSRGSGWRWRASWAGSTPGRYRVVLAARPGVDELSAECVTAVRANPPPRRRTR
jgi:neutral ceramidase